MTTKSVSQADAILRSKVGKSVQKRPYFVRITLAPETDWRPEVEGQMTPS
jgi:hypothetical protein